MPLRLPPEYVLTGGRPRDPESWAESVCLTDRIQFKTYLTYVSACVKLGVNRFLALRSKFLDNRPSEMNSKTWPHRRASQQASRPGVCNSRFRPPGPTSLPDRLAAKPTGPQVPQSISGPHVLPRQIIRRGNPPIEVKPPSNSTLVIYTTPPLLASQETPSQRHLSGKIVQIASLRRF